MSVSVSVCMYILSVSVSVSQFQESTLMLGVRKNHTALVRSVLVLCHDLFVCDVTHFICDMTHLYVI